MAIAVHRSDLSRRWSEFLYLSISLPLGFAWVILLGVLLAVGVATAIVTVGFVLLGITVMIWRFGADLERWTARLRDRSTWRDLAYMLLLGPVGVVAGGLTIAL